MNTIPVLIVSCELNVALRERLGPNLEPGASNMYYLSMLRVLFIVCCDAAGCRDTRPKTFQSTYPFQHYNEIILILHIIL